MIKTQNKIRQPWQDRALDAFFYGLLSIALIVCAYPIWFVVMASVSDSVVVYSGKLLLFPVNFHLSAYEHIFTKTDLGTGYVNTLIYVIGGTLFGLAVVLPAGYALSRKDMKGRKIVNLIMVFTMYFSGGLVPTYLLFRDLKLLDTRLLLTVISAAQVADVFVVRTFFSSSIPDEMREATMVDGCGNTRFFLQFVLPLSKAIIAVITLYIAVDKWNSYFPAMIYTNKEELHPLQLMLRFLLFQQSAADPSADAELFAKHQQIQMLIKYAAIVFSTLPIMCLYPLLQKYFVQGVMQGALKG